MSPPRALPCEKIHPFYLYRYFCVTTLVRPACPVHPEVSKGPFVDSPSIPQGERGLTKHEWIADIVGKTGNAPIAMHQRTKCRAAL